MNEKFGSTNKSAGEQKIDQYVDRIKGGETLESLGDIPESWKDKIRSGLGEGNDEAPLPPQVKTVQPEEWQAQAAVDRQEIAEIRKELGISQEDAFAKKEYTDDEEHNRAVGIYNTLMDIGKGMKEGLAENFQKKTQEYSDQINAGQDKERVMQGLPESFRAAVEERLKERREAKVASGNDQVEPVTDLAGRVNEDYEHMSHQELIDQAKLRHDMEYWKRRGRLQDDLFAAGRANLYEEDDGNVRIWKGVEGSIGKHFDAHGIAKLDQLEKLLSLLDNGIDATKTFYTAPFEIPDEKKSGAGAGLGTGDGTAYKDGIAVLTGSFDKSLAKDGIEHVFLNDVYQDMRAPLAAAYPQYKFHLLSEQKQVLESEAENGKSKKS